MNQYAVVSFLDEFIDNEQVVSEIPTTWLHSNNTMCKWPPTHESYHILKYSAPKPEWTDHRVRCERIYDTREEARKKCMRDPDAGSSSTSDDTNLGRTCRKKKPSKLLTNYYNTCPSPPNLGDNESEGSEDTHTSNAMVNEDSGSTHFVQEDNYHNVGLPPIEETVYEELHPPSQHAPPFHQELDMNRNSVPYHTATVFNRRMIPTTVDEKLDHIINLLAGIKMDIETSVNKNGYNNLSIQPSDWTEFNGFPFNNLNDLQIMETKITENPDLKIRMVQFLKHVGGTCTKDLHTRCSKQIFTNGLAEQCSWKGFRKNFKVEDLHIIRCLYDAVNGTYPCTMKEFEILTKDFFRHAKQRREREEKQ